MEKRDLRMSSQCLTVFVELSRVFSYIWASEFPEGWEKNFVHSLRVVQEADAIAYVATLNLYPGTKSDANFPSSVGAFHGLLNGKYSYLNRLVDVVVVRISDTDRIIGYV